MSYIIRIWINKFTILKLACTITGGLFTIWGLASLFNPLDGVFKDETNLCKFFIGVFVVLIVFIVSLIIACIRVLCSNQVCLGESSTKKCVYVKYGDMYSPDIIEKDYNEKRAIVIPVNRCFDTIVNDRLVSSNTQHGRAFQKLYSSRRFTHESLNEEIQNILNQNNQQGYEDLTQEEKPEGNLRRYEVGTTVNLQIEDKLSYYLLGLSYFDEHLNAHTSKTDYVLAVQKLIEFCNRNSQGYPVILPLLGSGLSRTNIKLNDILHYIADAFAINKDIINNDYYIVVWKGDKDKVAINELREW